MSGQIKFNTLLLLKDLLKTKTKRIVDYTQKKMLKRLFVLSSSEARENCLLDIDPTSDQEWSAHFHQLNLETLGMWAENFKESNPEYFKVASKLLEMERLPVNEKYYNFPSIQESQEISEKYKGSGQLSRTISQEHFQFAQRNPGNGFAVKF